MQAPFLVPHLMLGHNPLTPDDDSQPIVVPDSETALRRPQLRPRSTLLVPQNTGNPLDTDTVPLANGRAPFIHDPFGTDSDNGL